jgi:hypothetical protein
MTTERAYCRYCQTERVHSIHRRGRTFVVRCRRCSKWARYTFSGC